MTATLQAPTSVGELLTLSGETARELAGADRTAWNGDVFASSGSILGLAHWDGTLYLDREAILEPLEHLYEHAGESHSTATLRGYRESLGTLLHEQAHFLGPSGATQDAAREGFIRPGSRQLEEGVTEAWAQDHLDDYINRLGIDKVASGINSVRSGGYYPAFVPAVRHLAAELETRNGLPPGQVLQDLNRQTAAGQFPLLVDLVYNSTRLPTLDPPGADTRPHLESILRTGLAQLDAYELTPPDVATTKSHLTAENLLTHLDHEIQTTESALTVRRAPSPTHTALSGLTPAARATSTPRTALTPPPRGTTPMAISSRGRIG